ncbi:MAG: endonuclease III [Candidatus Kryptonium sp.]|nr:endonuclease III [Candidatus Kryptonium sp.]
MVKKSNSDLKLKNKLLKISKEIEKLFKVERQESSNPLDILIATILSQNTNDVNSHRAFKNLKEKFSDYDSVLNANVGEIEKAIKIGGLARQKAKRIKKLLLKLKEKRGNFDLSFLKDLSVDEGLKFLTSFEGVGLKTASCVLLFGFNKEVFPVDTHIHRILNRVGIVKTKTPDETFLSVQKLIPQGLAYHLHTGLIKFGRTICRAQNPLCGICPIYRICGFEKKNFYRKKSGKLKLIKSENAEFILLNKV